MRFHIIGNARIKNVGKYQSCMVSKLPVIWKQDSAIASDETELTKMAAEAAEELDPFGTNVPCQSFKLRLLVVEAMCLSYGCVYT